MKIRNYSFLLLAVVLLISSCASAEVRAVRKGDIEAIEKFLAEGGDPDTSYDDGNALIHIAIMSGQAQSLDRLLQAGANPNLRNRAGNTPSILAAGIDRADMINLLLNSGGDMRTVGKSGVTTLMLSASKGNIALMDLFLKLGVPIDSGDNSGRTALFYSISAPSPNALDFLIQAGSNAKKIDNEERTPLHLLNGNREVAYAKLLINAGTDLSAKQISNGETALHIASGAAAWELVDLYLANGALVQINQVSTALGAPLFYGLRSARPEPDILKTINVLLDSGADPNMPSNNNVFPIVHAVENLGFPIIEVLLKSGADLNVRFDESKTLLHKSVIRNIPELTALLLDLGMNPDSQDINGRTALFDAVEAVNLRVAEILLAKGADPNVTGNDGRNPLFVSLEKDIGRPSGFFPMTELLLTYGADLPSDRKKLSTLLMNTGKSGNSEAARLLLQAGADPDKKNREGVTVLMMASTGRFSDLSDLLLLWGARVNSLDNKGRAAMHYASQAGFVAGVELLLRFDADPDPIDFTNIRPIQLAPANAQGARIVEILLLAGADPLPVEEPIIAEEDTDGEAGVVEDAATEETVIDEPEEDEVIADSEVDEEEPDEAEAAADELWNKARILALGESEPRRISRGRKTFPGFSASVPEAFPQNFYSKFNNREVTLNIRNESDEVAEVYIVNSDGTTDAIGRIASGESFQLGTWQGNYYPVYSSEGVYFGIMQTTGQEEQFYRLVESD